MVRVNQVEVNQVQVNKVEMDLVAEVKLAGFLTSSFAALLKFSHFRK